MGFSFIHIATDTKAQGALDRHNRGENRPTEALTRPEWDHRPTIRIAGDEDRAVEVLVDVENDRGRGRQGCQRVRILFGHPPPFESENAWDRDRLLSWAKDSASWIEQEIKQASGGTAVLERVDLHLDETSPHLHASIIPAVPRAPTEDQRVRILFGRPHPDEEPLKLKLSWSQLQRSMTPDATSRSGSMRMLQDMYHADVGSRYGLERGKPSTRTRAEPNRVEGLKTRVRLTEERAARAEREAQARAERVEQRARQQGRAAAVERDATKGRVARAQHAVRATRSQNQQLRADAARAARARAARGRG